MADVTLEDVIHKSPICPDLAFSGTTVHADTNPTEDKVTRKRKFGEDDSYSYLDPGSQQGEALRRRTHDLRRNLHPPFSIKRHAVDDRDSRLVITNLESHAKGYPRVAAFVNSDRKSALFRRFGDLHARSLLYKQVELTELEAELANIDKTDDNELTRWRLGCSIHVKDGSKNEARRDLILKIDKKLKTYGQLLLQDTELRKLPRPDRRTFRNFFTWIYTENSFTGSEQDFVFHQNDFVSAELYETSWLDSTLVLMIRWCNNSIIMYIISSKQDRAKTDDPDVMYHSEARLDTFVKIIIAVASTSLLLIPVFIFLSSNLSAIKMTGITLLFSFIFAAAISFFTSGKRQDVFAVTAAYCAVLVVFIGNLQQKQLA